MPPTASRASLVLLHQIHFNDTLLKDMGARIKAPGTALARSLPQIAYVLDDHPDVVAAYAREITQVCLALMAERRRAAPRSR